MSTVLEVLTDAHRELGVIAGTETLGDADAAFGLSKLNRLIDSWNATGHAAISETVTEYTLTPLLQPHTIGPSGQTYTASVAPMVIDGAALILDTLTPDAFLPIAIRDAVWWQALTIPDLTSAIPTDLYYERGNVNGAINLWPVPTTAYQLQLMVRRILTAFGATSDTFALPPGYQDAITLTLAEDLAPSFRMQLLPSMARKAQQARALVFANNETPVRVASRNAGMPGGSGGGFDFRTGRNI